MNHKKESDQLLWIQSWKITTITSFTKVFGSKKKYIIYTNVFFIMLRFINKKRRLIYKFQYKDQHPHSFVCINNIFNVHLI